MWGPLGAPVARPTSSQGSESRRSSGENDANAGVGGLEWGFAFFSSWGIGWTGYLADGFFHILWWAFDQLGISVYGAEPWARVKFGCRVLALVTVVYVCFRFLNWALAPVVYITIWGTRLFRFSGLQSRIPRISPSMTSTGGAPRRLSPLVMCFLS